MKNDCIDTSSPAGRITGLILWATALLLLLWPLTPSLFGNRTMVPADNLFAFPPFRAAAGELGVARPHTPLYSDLILENYPWWRFIRHSLARGQLPLWNPYTFSGTPFLAKGQHLALYPLSIVFYVLPLERAYSIFLLLHFGLAACAAALLARTVGISRFGAFLGGMIYGFSGFMLARAVFPMIIAAAAWLPLVLAMAERIIVRWPVRGRPRVLPWVAGGGMGLGMQGLVGHPEILIYTLLTLGFYSLWRLVARRRGVAAGDLRPAILSLATMAVLGLLVAAVQLLPQFLVLRDNFRTDTASFSQVLGWSSPWQQLVTLLVPDYFGNPARYDYTNLFTGRTVTAAEPLCWGTKNFVEGAAYVGILPLVLALAGWGRHRHAPAAGAGAPPGPALFWILTLLSLCFALGTPLYLLIYTLPGMEQVHSPFRWMLVATLGVAILAGYGCDRLRAAPGRALLAARLCLGSGTGLLVILLLARLFISSAQPALAAILRASGGNGTIFPDAEAFFSFELPLLVRLAILLVLAAVALHVMARDTGRLWQGLTVLVIGLDLFLFVRHLYPAVDPKLLRYRPPIIARMQQDRTRWRFTTFDPEGKKILPANAAWLYDLQDIRGYDSIFSARYRRFMETIDTQDQLLYNRIAPLQSARALDSPLLDLLNVRYVLSEQVINNPGYQLVARGDGLLLYSNSDALPRAFTLPVTSTVTAEDPWLAMTRFDPRFFMILPGKGRDGSGGLRQPEPGQAQAAEIIACSNNEVIVRVRAEEPVWLVLADGWDAGWRARAWPAGQPEQAVRLPVRQAYGTLRAVRLEQGEWQVRFRYLPPGLISGLALSLAALLFMIVSPLFRRSIPPPQPEIS